MTFFPFDIRTIIKPEGLPTLEVDVSPTQDHDLENEITAFPVEDGTIVSDHITILPNVVELDLTFSDTPISHFDPTLQFDSAEGRSRALFRQLQDIKNGKVRCTLITGLQSYRNMFIMKIGVPRRSGEGKKVTCLTTFKELIIVSRAGSGIQGVVTPVTTDVAHTAIGLIEIGDLG